MRDLGVHRLGQLEPLIERDEPRSPPSSAAANPRNGSTPAWTTPTPSWRARRSSRPSATRRAPAPLSRTHPTSAAPQTPECSRCAATPESVRRSPRRVCCRADSSCRNARNSSVVALWNACSSNHLRRKASNASRPNFDSRNDQEQLPLFVRHVENASSGSRPVRSGSSVRSPATSSVLRDSARSLTPIAACMSAHALAVQRLDDAAFEVGGEAFVEPEVVPGGVGDEVARPGMRELVRDERDERLVAGDHRRRGERQPRVLHAAERERRRQHQQVVASPAVRSVERLGGRDHLLGVFELARRGVHD